MSKGFSIPMLHSGDMAQVRPITPSDKLTLKNSFALLSDDSKFNRFLSPVKDLSSRHLAYFTEMDQVDHVAWGIAVPRDSEMLGVAVGRYVRLKEEPNVAEFALTVIDPFQGKGLGTFLLALLYRIAQQQGDIQQLRGVIGNHNNKMISWMRQLGANVYLSKSFLTHADIQVMPDEPQLPENHAANHFSRIFTLIRILTDSKIHQAQP